MNSDLRPMGIWEILSGTFALYQRRFATFVAISAVVSVPYALLMALLGSAVRAVLPVTQAGDDTSFWSRIDFNHLEDGASASLSGAWASGPMHADLDLSPTTLIGGAVVALIGMLVYLGLVYPLGQGALLLQISAHYLGEDLSPRESFARMRQRLGRLLAAQSLVALWVCLGFLCCVVPGIVAALWFMIVPAVVLLEDHSSSGTLKRSRALMKGHLARAFALGFVATLASLVFEGIAGWVVGRVPWPSPFLADFAENLVETLTLPFSLGTTVLFYYDLRIRKEAFDLALLGAKMGDLQAR